MARYQRDIVNYFPHDASASTGDTLTVLQSRFGNDGYAFWFKLLEKLASTEGHYLDCRNCTKWQLLLAKTGVNEITGVDIMDLLVEMQAIDKELWGLKVIWCQKLVDNIAEVYKNRRREIPKKPISTGNNALSTGNNTITTEDNPQSKVKYSRVNKSKVDIASSPTFEVYKEKLKGKYPDLDIDDEWERCQIWYRDHKKKIKSPSLALGNWCRKEEEQRGKARRSPGQTPGKIDTYDDKPLPGLPDPRVDKPRSRVIDPSTEPGIRRV